MFPPTFTGSCRRKVPRDAATIRSSSELQAHSCWLHSRRWSVFTLDRRVPVPNVSLSSGYASPLQSLETEGLFSKVHLLKSYDDMAYELKRLNLRDVTFPDLFETKVQQ